MLDPLGELAAGRGHYPPADLDDQPGLLCQWNEPIGLKQPACRMFPPQQGLKANNAVAVEGNNGLILDHELPRVERNTQVMLQLESRHGGRVKPWVVATQATLPFGLGLIHGQVSVAKEHVAVVPRRCDRVPDTGADEDLGFPNLECRRERLDQATPQLIRIHLGGNVLGEDGELVATQPRDGIDRPHRSAEPLTDRGKEQVARRVPKAIVDCLEVIEVKEEDGQSLAVGDALKACYRVLQPIAEQRPVRQARERILERLSSQLLLHGALVGDVAVRHRDAPNRRIVREILPKCHDSAPSSVRVADANLGIHLRARC